MKGLLVIFMVTSSFAIDCDKLSKRVGSLNISFKHDHDDTLPELIGYGLSPIESPCGSCRFSGKKERKQCYDSGVCRYLSTLVADLGVSVQTQAPIYSAVDTYKKWQLRFFSNETCNSGFIDGFRH